MGEELKINMPLFNIGEEAELENKLLFHLDEFTNEIMKTMSKDKDIIILKKVIEQQQKEINFYKNEELGYMAGYEDGKRHKQTAVMIKKENAQQELFEKEIVRLKKIIEKQQKELEEKNKDIKKLNDLLMLSELDYISKDKIREKLNYFEHSFDYDDDGTSYELVMEVLAELLEE